VVAVLVWLVWPAVDGGGDVVIVGDAAASPTFAPTVTQVRDNGRQATVAATVADACELPDRLAEVAVDDGVDYVVIAVADTGDCGDVVTSTVTVARQRGLEPVVVRFPGVDTGVDPAEVALVDTERLLGSPGTLEVGCEWWDRVDPFLADGPLACSPDDLVVVRSGDGSLTTAGFDRIARMVAASIG
jgi:hypothetical protein